jgi:signal peptidase I
MTVGMIVGLWIVALVASLLVNAAILWLVGRWLRFARATWLRSSAAASLVWVLTVPIVAVSYAGVYLGTLLVLLAAAIVVTFFVIHLVVGTTRGKSCVATFAWLIGANAAGWGLALGISTFLIASYRIEAGSMAPTLCGMHADVICTNCGSVIRAPVRFDPHRGRLVESREAECGNCLRREVFDLQNVDFCRGDRIVADKTMFPRRWELAVVWHHEKAEAFPRFGSDSRQASKVSYVKRLVGLPGELVQLADGDVFIDGHRLRKLPGEQEELWFPVYSSQYLPSVVEQPLWRTEREASAWKFMGDISFAGEATEPEELILTRPIDNWLSYNTDTNFGPDQDVYPSPDARLSCELAEFSGDGAFGFTWRYGDMEIRAAVAASGEVNLTMTGDSLRDDDAIASESPQPLAGGQRWSFSHRDGRVYVEQDDRILASRLVGSGRFEDAISRPDCHVGFFAERCQLRFSRVQVDRDVYYIPPEGERIGELDPTRQFRLGDDEYFLLGDNSARSLDSRVWGPVKEDDFVGVVRAIFWPVSRWRAFP